MKGILLLACLATAFALVQETPAGEKFPINGKAGPGLEPFDDLVIAMMNRHGVPGGALAIAKDGKLVYAKGFGYADLAGPEVDPETLFLLASVSKPITAAAIVTITA